MGMEWNGREQKKGSPPLWTNDNCTNKHVWENSMAIRHMWTTNINIGQRNTNWKSFLHSKTFVKLPIMSTRTQPSMQNSFVLFFFLPLKIDDVILASYYFRCNVWLLSLLNWLAQWTGKNAKIYNICLGMWLHVQLFFLWFSVSICPKNIYRRRCAIVGILNSLKIMMKFTVICSKIRLFFSV